MSTQIKFEVSSGNKSYASRAGAAKAAHDSYPDNPNLRFLITIAENGRFIPVFIGNNALQAGVHFKHYVAN